MPVLDRVPEVDFLGTRARILADAESTGGRFGLVEMIDVQPNSMPPLHVHHSEDEGFYVMSGEVTFFMPGEEVTLTAGDFFLAPKDVPHTYRVGETATSWLTSSVPAGFERFVAAVGGLDDVNPETLGAAAAECNIEILGPPGAMP